MCEDYLKTFHRKELINILQEEDVRKHYSIYVNFLVLYESCQSLGLNLLKDSETALQEWSVAAVRAQMALLKEVDKKCNLKSNINCRIFNLTTCSQSNGAFFPDNKHVGKFVQLSGTVMRMTAAKLLEYQRSYICVKCKTPIVIRAEYDKKYIVKEPKICNNPEGCSGTNLICMGELDSENCKDYQEIKIQERVKESGIGALHNTLLVTLEDDLVDSCKPGDNVTICGLVKRRWGEFSKGKKIDIEIALKANYLQVDNKSFPIAATPETLQLFNTFWENYSDNPLLGRDTILKSICPQIYGRYLVKLAIAIVIAGGCQMDKTSTGIRTRSESHLLLVGDPGTGKSHLLQFASKIVPRAVLTTGVGSTAAGLTVTAILERGEWQLEAGALVMADGGICCIDEFNSMKEHDRTSIHEAMEQQTISIAKASLVCKMNTRCSILAACNPKGNVNLSESLSMNIALPSPLLSRFDLVLILKDEVNEEWDSLVADYILNSDKTFSKFAKNKLWNEDILQSYFVIIKKFIPKLTDDAELILSTYYQMQRRIDNRNKARTTVRLLESLVRLSQGHARLMYHERVEIVDSIYAIILVDTSMERDSSIFNLNINTNSIFPDKPSSEYRQMVEIVLNKLQLGPLLEKELEMLSKTKECKVQSRFFHQQTNSIDRHIEDTVNSDIPSHQIDLSVNKKRKSDSENTENQIKKLPRITIIDSLSPEKLPTNYVTEKGNKKHHTSTDEGYDTVSFTSILNNSKNESSENVSVMNKTVVGRNKMDVSKINVKPCRLTSPLKNNSINLSKSNDNTNEKHESSTPKIVEETLANKNISKIIDQSEDQQDQVVEKPVEKPVEKELNSSKEVKKKILSKFKYVPRPKDDKSNNRNQIEVKVSEGRNETQGVKDLEKSSKILATSKGKKLKSKKPEVCSSFENDLKCLSLMPGVNDDFNIDLNFDWDNFDQINCLSSTKLSQKSNKGDNKLRTNSMFETEDNIDEMDFDL